MSFRWIPAGMRPDTLYGAEMYVRFEKTGANRITFKTNYETGQSIITCPDRTILMQRGFTGPKSRRPVNENYDLFIIMDPYRKGGISEKYFDMMLMSAYSVGRKSTIDKEAYYQSTVKIMADSGGAQLRFGSGTFIDPIKIAKFYSEVADVGMALDIPPRSGDARYKNGMKALAIAQKRNSDIILSNLTKDVPVLNVVHGTNLESVRNWGDIVYDPKMPDGWGIGTDAYTDLCCIQSALVGAFELPNGNKHIHLFGWGSPIMMPIFAWIGRYVDTITTDSSSNVFSAMRSRIGSFFTDKDYVRNTPVGLETKRIENPHIPISCCCPVCSAIGWLDVYGLAQEARVTFPLSWHNMFTIQMYAKHWDYFAQTVSTLDEYKGIVRAMFHNKKTYLRELLTYLDYIEYARDNGLDKARVKFNVHAEENWGISQAKINPVFANKKVEEKEAIFTHLHTRNPIILDALPLYMSKEERKELGVELLESEDAEIECKLEYKPVKVRKVRKVKKVKKSSLKNQ